MKCPECKGMRRVAFLSAEDTKGDSVVVEPERFIDCPACGGTGEAPVYTQEELATMPCPLPPEPDAQRMWDETPDAGEEPGKDHDADV